MAKAMENPDPSTFARELAQLGGHVSPLGPQHWEKPGQRSRELTPLYVQRYAGPRRPTSLTSHTFWELTYVFAGRGRMIADVEQPMQPGCVLLVPPGVKHSEDAPQSVDTLWVGLTGSMLSDWPRSLIRRIENPSVAQPLEQMWILTRMSRQKIGLELEGLLRQVVGRIQAHNLDAASDWPTRALTWLHNHMHEPITVAHLADAMACSEGYLHRRFKKTVGQTPNQALTQLRLERARELMQHTTLSIKQIAQRTGFTDQLYFSRVFRKTYGYPPTTIAAQLRENVR